MSSPFSDLAIKSNVSFSKRVSTPRFAPLRSFNHVIDSSCIFCSAGGTTHPPVSACSSMFSCQICWAPFILECPIHVEIQSKRCRVETLRKILNLSLIKYIQAMANTKYLQFRVNPILDRVQDIPIMEGNESPPA